ncbi:ABC transporter permease [Dactylosporangium darangshiense]|uniref:FtsX-like permease family protein n=1 Tax=Dactylosporangium darangshiense TaxID=579108 RepID=A0ABP8DG80_9ACTN
MIRLALGTLRRHRGAYAGTFLAALLAVALLGAGGLLLFSVLTARAPADRFAGADAVVSGEREVTATTVTHKKKGKTKTKTKTERLTGAGTLPADLAGRLAALPGVREAVADYAFPVQLAVDQRTVRGADGAPVVGHGWASAALTPFALRAGAPPKAGEAVVDADLAARARLSPGSTVEVTTRAGVRSLRVSGIAAPAQANGLPAQGALFVADGEVAALSGLAGPTAIAVRTADPATFAAAALRVTDAPVLTGDDRVRADLPGALPDYVAPISIFGFVIGITAFAAVFVLVGTVALGVRQRLRELALLRTIGATPRTLRRLLGVEAAVLGLVASIPAAPLGAAIAGMIAGRFRDLGVVPAQFAVRVNGGVLVAAAFAGVLLTVLSARIAARRAVRIAPTQALAETAVAPRGAGALRVVLSVVAAAGAVTVLSVVPLDGPLGMGMSFVSCALLLCAVAASGPLLVRGLTAVVARLAPGRAGRLAGLIARAEYRRVAAVAVPLVLMFAVNATMLLNSSLLTRLAGDEQAARGAPADVRVDTAAGLPLTAAEELIRASGAAGAAATIPTRAILVRGGKPEDYAAQGLLSTGAPALDLGVRDGALRPDGLAMSAFLARQEGLRVGDRVPVWLADGFRTELPLTAVYERSHGFGELVLPASLVAAHDPRGLVTGLALRGTTQGAPVRTAAPAPADAPQQQGAWELMVAVSLGFTAIAVVNTFAIATAARRREYADLRLAGATGTQVRRLVTAEAGITVAVGALLGAAVTAIVVGAFSVAQDGVFRVFVDPPVYAALLGGTALLGLIAGAVPVRFVVRKRCVTWSE